MLSACSVLPTDAGEDERSPRPTPAGDTQSYAHIAAGFVHTCALNDVGKAYCWGNNDYGQLGTADVEHTCGGRPCSPRPVAVAGGRTFRHLAAGWVQNCGIGTDGGTYCWGGGALEGKGYLGDGSLSRSVTPVRVVADSQFASVTIGDGHACALTASGMAFCWGQNTQGGVGDGSTTDRATPVSVLTALRFRSLSAGARHTCGITLANQAYCWGDNRWGQLGAGDVAYNSTSATTEPVRVSGGFAFSAIAAGWEHTCAVATTGSAYCWGRNDDARQLGDESNVTHRGSPGPVAGAHAFASLTAGALATCGRTTADGVYCWGANYHGSLGNGEVDPTGVGRPVRTLGGPFERVAIGQAHACAIAETGRLWCWGDQSAGQF